LSILYCHNIILYCRNKYALKLLVYIEGNTEEWARLAVQDADYFKESLTYAATTLKS